MLSGVGDEEELKRHGISTVRHLPGVGKNLQDHLEVYVQQVGPFYIHLVHKFTRFPHGLTVFLGNSRMSLIII